jgi:glucose-6-phosphate isomerase, archaeal
MVDAHLSSPTSDRQPAEETRSVSVHRLTFWNAACHEHASETFCDRSILGNIMLFPQGVKIDGLTGNVSPETGRYTKRLSELRAVFLDKDAVDEAVRQQHDPIIYEVVEYKKEGSDLFFGTTTMQPGFVAGEFYMTRGHFHARRDMGEVYYTQSGSGLLLLESRDGRSEMVELTPGVCAFIPPDWAHRSINTGKEKLVFVWVCNVAAGQDYGEILTKGMKKRVFRAEDGSARIADRMTPGWA